MARRFTELEKADVRENLRAAGRALFAERGLQKTSVGELTAAAGIAAGTFYLFYESKEALFFEVLQQEEERIRLTLFERHLSSEGPMTRAAFERFLEESLFTLAEHPLIRLLYDEETMSQLFRKLSPETLAKHASSDEDALEPFVARGQREGWLREEAPATIVSLIRSAVLFSFQKDRIGEALYEPTLRLLISCLAEGLIVESEADRE
ncbi:TetR/AcrR family transcriptional regulator [Paenibacillus sp. TRM 82003]|nr:TetR/AcrR family transcriptional regulator [Paenibacillus sp. TRM 82003]